MNEWELKLYFYPSAGGFYKKLKNVSCEYKKKKKKIWSDGPEYPAVTAVTAGDSVMRL